MKKTLFLIGIIIFLSACSSNKVGEIKDHQPAEQVMKPHPSESSDAASKAYHLFDAKVGTYIQLVSDYKRDFKEDGKSTSEDAANFNDLYNQAVKLRDMVTPLVDQLDTNNYEAFNRDCGYMSDYKIEIQTFISQHK